VEDLIV